MTEIKDKTGFIIWEPRDHNIAEICDIVVEESLRRQGNGKKLLNKAAAQMRKKEVRYCYVFTELTNVGAQRFYTAMGFNRVGDLLNFYSGTRHGVIFGRVI